MKSTQDWLKLLLVRALSPNMVYDGTTHAYVQGLVPINISLDEYKELCKLVFKEK